MTFLLSFMQERASCTNLKDFSDDDDEDEPNEDQYDDKNNRIENDRNNDRENDNDDDKNDVDEESNAENKKKKKQKEINTKMISLVRNKGNRYQTQPETASAVVMKYLLNKKTTQPLITPSTLRLLQQQ